MLCSLQIFLKRVVEIARKRMYFAGAVLILLGVLAMRWNVVIGGQLFSTSLREFMSYKMEFAGHEGWLLFLGVLCLPFIILTVFVKYFLAPNPKTNGHAMDSISTAELSLARGRN